jgi:hypothetical protein
MLMATVWPRGDFTRPGELERLSKALGVRANVLKEASDRIDDEKRAQGLRTRKGVKVNEMGWPQLELDFPERVYDDWLTWCELRAGRSTALIRGILHEYLLNTWEPEGTNSTWCYKGKLYVLNKRPWEEKHHRAWPYRERIFVAVGAKHALHFRANRTNVSSTAILRGLVLEALEGKMDNIRPMDARSMFEDPLRYTKHLEEA